MGNAKVQFVLTIVNSAQLALAMMFIVTQVVKPLADHYNINAICVAILATIVYHIMVF